MPTLVWFFFDALGASKGHTTQQRYKDNIAARGNVAHIIEKDLEILTDMDITNFDFEKARDTISGLKQKFTLNINSLKITRIDRPVVAPVEEDGGDNPLHNVPP